MNKDTNLSVRDLSQYCGRSGSYNRIRGSLCLPAGQILVKQGSTTRLIKSIYEYFLLAIRHLAHIFTLLPFLFLTPFTFLQLAYSNVQRGCPRAIGTEPPHHLRTWHKKPRAGSKVEQSVNSQIVNVPSSFNAQTICLVVLLHAGHVKLWDIVIEVFDRLVKSGVVPEKMWTNQTLPKLQCFNAYGAVRFFPWNK